MAIEIDSLEMLREVSKNRPTRTKTYRIDEEVLRRYNIEVTD
jgi:hypothetical protein